MNEDGIRDFEDLMVWQKAMSLVVEIYQTTEPFPSTETFGLTQQLRRAAVSIPSNIAEGHGRAGNNDSLVFCASPWVRPMKFRLKSNLPAGFDTSPTPSTPR